MLIFFTGFQKTPLTEIMISEINIQGLVQIPFDSFAEITLNTTPTAVLLLKNARSGELGGNYVIRLAYVLSQKHMTNLYQNSD